LASSPAPREPIQPAAGGHTKGFGFDMARTREDMPLLERRPGWRELKAVQRDRIFVADGNQYFNRPGPRLVESLEMLAEIFHPELFPSRYEGKGWMHYVAEPRVKK